MTQALVIKKLPLEREFNSSSMSNISNSFCVFRWLSTDRLTKCPRWMDKSIIGHSFKVDLQYVDFSAKCLHVFDSL